MNYDHSTGRPEGYAVTWVKLDDQFPDHPKVLEVGPAAAWLYICGLAYASRYLTDGFIPTAEIKRIHRSISAKKLVGVGLWTHVEGGYRVADWLNCGLLSDQQALESVRSEARRRWRDVVFTRDGLRCVRCGDGTELTIDHVVPLSKGGGNDIDNLQTLCRSCNSRKGAR